LDDFLIKPPTKPIINFLNSLMNMKRITLLLIAVIGFNVSGWSQDPDYTKLVFKSKIREYKKKKPNFEKVKFSKDDIKQIVTLLGSSFYNQNDLEDITEKIWLSFIDPRMFDFVFKDIAVRTIPNWNKKNYKGQIVVEPSPFLAEWTSADGEKPYFQRAINLLLVHYKLMGYSEDAKLTKNHLKKILYTQKMNFRPVSSSDWTNSYLQAANMAIQSKGLIACIDANGQYEYFICENDKKGELLKLFKKMDWEFIVP